MAIEKVVQRFSRCCVWRSGPPRGGKPSKMPINPNTGAPAKANDAETFGTYEQAQAAYAGGGYEGLGVLMASGGATIIIDIDDCLGSDGAPDALAQVALDLFSGTYCEVSHSGRGLHFVLVGALPEWVTREKVSVDGHSLEVYSSASTRFLCVTGNELREAEVIECQPALEAFLRKFDFNAVAKAPGFTSNRDTSHVITGTATDAREVAEIIALMLRSKKRAKIARLFAGDLGDYAGGASEADLGLCSEIAFYTKDADTLALVFEHSELAKRDKWQKRADYREATIDKAIAGATGDYFEWRKGAGKGKKALGTALAQYGEKLQGGADDLESMKNGQLASTIENGIQVLLRDHRTQGVCGFNLFAGAPHALRPLCDVFGPSAMSPAGEFLEGDVTAVRAWFGKEYRMRFSKDDTLDIICAWAKHVQFNPVTEALDRAFAEYDGVKRLDSWLAVYLGVDVSVAPEYHKAIGRKFLIGAVARAYQPGCAMQNMLVLEGPQGCGKSRAVRVIGETLWPPGFTETVPILRESSKESAMHLRGIHIAEMQELSSLSKADANAIKEFISTAHDRLRLPYAKTATTQGRTAVLIGSTNENFYVQDVTGGRRFWGCEVGKIDVDKLRADMPQLFGEAVAAYRAHEDWRELRGPELERQAAVQQAQRQIGEAWDENVVEYMAKLFTTIASLSRRFKLVELFGAVFPASRIEVNGQDFDKLTQMRFSGCLKRSGFERKASNGSYWQLADATVERLKRDILMACPAPGGLSVLQKQKNISLTMSPEATQIH